MGFHGRRYLRFLKRRDIRTSVESSLDAANAVPDSGFTFVENSQGASVAASELSRTLDTAIEQVDLEGDLAEQLRVQLGLLDEKAAEFSNCSLAGLTLQTQWTCSQSEAEVISIAWECAAGVYYPTSDIRSDGFEFNVQNYVPSSTGRAIKATAFTLVDTGASQKASNPFLPVLVIAVRGTASRMDHIVNVNSRPKNASCLFDTEYPDQGNAEIEASVEAHAGFLNSARELKELVSQRVDDSVKQGNVKHVLFTGHSAGGAVASLLSLRYLLRGKSKYPSVRFSLITFGSPPVLRPGLGPLEYMAAEDGLLLNIINEYDLVSRVDRPYIRTLVDLYRSIYQLPPIQDSNSQTTGLTDNGSTHKGETWGDRDRKYWIVPKPEYYHIGKRVVLKLGIVPDQWSNHEDSDDPKGQLSLSASCISAEEFAKLLFCRINVHSRACYEERVALIRESRFNGKSGWLPKVDMPES